MMRRKVHTFVSQVHLSKVWVEPLLGEAKVWPRLAPFRLRGLLKVNRAASLSRQGKISSGCSPSEGGGAGHGPLEPLDSWSTRVKMTNRHATFRQ
jgi:hypothetical protein